MHAHIYTMHKRRLRWNFHVLDCKRWSCNSRCEHLEIQSDYGGNFPLQRNSRKTNKRREKLGFLYSRQQVETLKHLIAYTNLRMYINPKRHECHARNRPSCMRPCIQAWHIKGFGLPCHMMFFVTSCLMALVSCD
jgi:hypothetical protein